MIGELTPELRDLVDAEIAASPGGGSQGLTVVRRELAFDTPGLQALALPVTAVDQGAKTFTVAGDYAAEIDRSIPNVSGFSITGSTGNDGFYTPTGSVFAAGHTTVTVVEAIPSAIADGNLNALIGGVSVYTPSDGDLLLGSFVTVGTAFNGSSSTIRVFQANTDPQTDDLAFDMAAADPVPVSSLSPNAWRQLRSPPNAQAWDLADSLTMSTAAGDVTALLCDTSTLGPDGSSAGECVLYLLILRAA